VNLPELHNVVVLVGLVFAAASALCALVVRVGCLRHEIESRREEFVRRTLEDRVEVRKLRRELDDG
jgi:hypothetical protein